MEAPIAHRSADRTSPQTTTHSFHTHTFPQVGNDRESARALLECWSTTRDSDAPGSIDSDASFFLPFLSAREGEHHPNVVLWRQGQQAAGILVGRRSFERPRLSIGPFKVPMPRLRTLEIAYGGLEAASAEVASLQADYLRELLQTKAVDCISVHHLPLASEIGSALYGGLREPGDGNPLVAGQWFAELTDAEGKALVSNSAKTRSSFRRKDRKLEQAFGGAVEIHECRRPAEVGAFIEAAADIGGRSYQGKIGVGVQSTHHWHTVLRILAANGYLRGYLLKAAGKPVAYAVGPAKGNTFTLMATSFLPEYRQQAPGAYLIRRMIERLQAEGLRWLDFGFGDAPYKELHGTWRREIATLHLYSHTPAARVARALDALVKGVDRGSRRILQRTGLYGRARKLLLRGD
ncbi:hypothetical protein Maes01_00715 [Microbulbifer aestuariivivens]|uniref:BioF2-like acetyltransferase domain-containing protein n=1 Tax=Microbulbifer aestuariivivens TaxID=1908308 RepID=A0ABP9WLT3_9GAMM